MIDYRKSVQEILSLEKEIDINKLKLEGVFLWPYLRSIIWQSKTNTSPVKQSTPSRLNYILETPKYLFKNSINLFKFVSLLIVTRISPANEIAFINNDAVNIMTNAKKKYDRIIDPVLEYSNNYRHARLVISDRNSTGTYHHQSVFLPLVFMGIFVKIGMFITTISQKNLMIRINILISKYAPDTDPKQVFDTIHYILYCRAIFKLWLKASRTKAVFLSCYYHPLHLGLSTACNELNVSCVDVQHGKQGKYHGLYGYWKNESRSGYQMIPKYFWNWGQMSVIHARRSSGKNYLRNHTNLVIGNMWIEKWKSGKVDYFLDKNDLKFLKHLKKYKLKLLVSLQPIAKPIPEFFWDGIRQLPYNTIVMLRLHPAMSASKNEIFQHIPQNVRSKVEMEHSTKVPLFALLKVTDIHITAFSSVAFEAHLFNKPTIIISEEGKDLYADELKSGVFKFANSGRSLAEIIKKLMNSTKPMHKSDYIIADKVKLHHNYQNFCSLIC